MLPSISAWLAFAKHAAVIDSVAIVIAQSRLDSSTGAIANPRISPEARP
jgi:hypothetical protein